MAEILLVEDDRSLSGSIALALGSDGHSVAQAYSAEQAQELLAGADIVLLDVSLPDKSGFELCRIIRESSDIPIIFITSYDEEADILRGLDSGGDDYITKPFRLNVLLSRVRAVLRRCTVQLPDMELTAVEKKLLEYLMLNRERFLTREQILAYLWDSKGCFVNDNTLSVNISRLRDKLRSSGRGQIITERGVGYKWTEQTS
ncbi:MAG: response regulator transcription factor [Ruminococcus sp.]|nr:response regulator transcription factor [Ruminococcus sp.]